jgi:hypothetical protein
MNSTDRMNRMNRKDSVNKIEDETGISITQEYLLEIINSNNG